MQELLKALSPVRKRLRTRRLLSGAAFGFAAGAGAALVLLAVTAFVPLENRWLWAAGVLSGAVLLCAAVNALRPLPPAEAARAADRCGLQERTVTALELAETPGEASGSAFAEVQRRDAVEHLRALDPRKIPLAFPKRLAAAGAALLLLCPAAALLPGGGDRLVSEQKAFGQKTASMAQAVEEAAQAEETGLEEKNRPELRKLTDDLKRDLAQSRTPEDALLALDRAENRLEAFRRQTAGDAMNALENALRAAGLDAAADALAAGDAAALGDALAAADPSALQQAAESLSGDARELADQLADAAQSGEQAEAQIGQALSGASAPQGPLQQTISGLKSSLGSQSAASSGKNQTPGASSANGQSGASPSGESQAAAASSGNGQGQGKGTGGGAGQGSTNEAQEGGGGTHQAGSRGSNPPTYKENPYESIYDPEKADAAFRDEMTEQHAGGRDSVQVETGPGKGTLEGNVPYRDVVGEYAASETKAADSAPLTKEQRGWVDEYYRRLTEEP